MVGQYTRGDLSCLPLMLLKVSADTMISWPPTAARA